MKYSIAEHHQQIVIALVCRYADIARQHGHNVVLAESKWVVRPLQVLSSNVVTMWVLRYSGSGHPDEWLRLWSMGTCNGSSIVTWVSYDGHV
jgi:hypothetical protein